MTSTENLLLKKKIQSGPNEDKMLKFKRPSGFGGAKAAEILSELQDMKLSEVRRYLRLRKLNPLGDITECKERLREVLETERDWANTNINSIQYRAAAREARESGDIPISNYYNPATSDAVLGALGFHQTAVYGKRQKLKLKKNRKVKQSTVHEFDIPGGRMRAGFVDVAGHGWQHDSVEFITINDWPVKNIRWDPGDGVEPASHAFEFRNQWYELVYRGNPLFGPPLMARCDAVQDYATGNIKLIFRYLGKFRDIPDIATSGAIPKRIHRRYDVYGVRNAAGPQPAGYEEALAKEDEKDWRNEQHAILEELKAEREDWITGHDEQGYVYYERKDGGEVETGGTRQYEKPEIQELLDQQLTLLGYMPGVEEAKRKARREKLALEKENERREQEEKHAKKVKAIEEELSAAQEKFEAMAEDVRMEAKLSRRADKEVLLYQQKLIVKKLTELLRQVAGRGAVLESVSETDKKESKEVMQFKALSEEEERERLAEQERERLAQEEADRSNPDQPDGDPRNWGNRAVIKWFLQSKVSRYADMLDKANWNGQQLIEAGEPELEAIGIASHIHRVIIIRQAIALADEWESTLARETADLMDTLRSTAEIIFLLAKETKQMVNGLQLELFQQRYKGAEKAIATFKEKRKSLETLTRPGSLDHIQISDDLKASWETITKALRNLEAAYESKMASKEKKLHDTRDAAAQEIILKKAINHAFECMDMEERAEEEAEMQQDSGSTEQDSRLSVGERILLKAARKRDIDKIALRKVAAAERYTKTLGELLHTIRASLAVNLITEQSKTIQEARTVLQDLLQQSQSASQRALNETNNALAIAETFVSGGIGNDKTRPNVTAKERTDLKRRADAVVKKITQLQSLVPPLKMLTGEGWGWVPRTWLSEVGNYLFLNHQENRSEDTIDEKEKN